MTKKFFMSLFFLLFSFLLTGVSCLKSPASTESTPTPVEEISIESTETPEAQVEKDPIIQSNLPENWSLDEKSVMSESELEDVAEKIGPGITGIENYYLNYKGESFQVNYVYFDNREDAERGFYNLMQMAGTVNTLALNGTTVIEIITFNDNLIKDLEKLLFTEDTEMSRPSDFFSECPEIMEYILKEGDIPGLILNKEFLASPSDVENFSQKFGTEVYATLHQYFALESGRIITINYILGKDEKAGQVIYDTLKSLVENPVMKKGDIIIEIFEQTGDTGEVKKNIVKYFTDAGFKQ